MTDTYEGWANRATWHVNLTIDNDYPLYKGKQRFMRAHGQAMTPHLVECFCRDYVEGDLSEVNWAELCEAWKYEAKEAEQCT